MWRLCNPAKPEQFFALGTIWTDSEVFVICHRSFAELNSRQRPRWIQRERDRGCTDLFSSTPIAGFKV
ncbi:hypothetical protein LINGRAHAP2_LOCUS24014 [Linum grandiflorum]